MLKSRTYLFTLLSVCLCSCLSNNKIAEPVPNDTPPLGDNRNHCIWPPNGLKLLDYSGDILFKSSDGNRVGIDYPTEFLEKTDTIEHFDVKPKQIISSKKEFEQLIHRSGNHINWRKNRVIIVQNSTLYKFNKLESSTNFIGYCLSNDKKEFILGFQSTFHGVCQGVAQEHNGYSNRSTTLYIVIPKRPSKITYYSCYEGPDCSKIP